MFNDPQPQPMQGPMPPPPNGEADMALLEGAHSAIDSFLSQLNAGSIELEAQIKTMQSNLNFVQRQLNARNYDSELIPKNETNDRTKTPHGRVFLHYDKNK